MRICHIWRLRIISWRPDWPQVLDTARLLRKSKEAVAAAAAILVLACGGGAQAVAAMAYGTDGSLSAFNLIVLSDPRGVQPVYEPAPIISGEVYDKYPEIGTILGPVFESLDLVTLQTLNGKIAVEGQNAADVARDYLAEKGFLK